MGQKGKDYGNKEKDESKFAFLNFSYFCKIVPAFVKVSQANFCKSFLKLFQLREE